MKIGTFGPNDPGSGWMPGNKDCGATYWKETTEHAKSAGPNRICRSKNCAVGKVEIRSQSEQPRDFLIQSESEFLAKSKDQEARFAARWKRVYVRTNSTRHATGNGLAYRATSNIVRLLQ